MKDIKKMKMIEAKNDKAYQESLEKAVEELQLENLEVEINHSMSQAQKGIGYMYSAVVVGRQK